MLTWVLDRQPLTLAVAVATLVLTAVLYILIPKGFFPVQDTGLIQVITEGPQSVSYEAIAFLPRARELRSLGGRWCGWTADSAMCCRRGCTPTGRRAATCGLKSWTRSPSPAGRS